MPSLTFARRVMMLSIDTDAVSGYLAKADAERLHTSKQIVPVEVRNGSVIIARHCYLNGQITARPGSYGIEREPLHTGHFIFQHKQTWAKQLAA